MSSIKISPLVLFLILIAVLVISYIFAYRTQEGFVSYQQQKQSLDYDIIPCYATRSVYKLWDSLYFDQRNANLIELDASRYNGNVDLIGNSITNVIVTPREGSSNAKSYSVRVTGTVVVPQNVDLSQRTIVPKAYNTWTYQTLCNNTDQYFVTYIPFDDSTYVHILNKTPSTPIQIGSFLFSQGSNSTFSKLLVGADGTGGPTIPITGTYNDVDANNNNMVAESMYSSNKNLYQIGKYVKYDLSNANLIIQKGDGGSRTLSIYDRNYINGRATAEVVTGGTAPLSVTTVGTVSNVSNFTSYSVFDACGQTMVLYMAIAKKTVVVLIKYDASTKNFSLGNVCRFDDTFIVKGSNGDRDNGNSNKPPTDSSISEYYKWYWYWKSGGGDGSMSNDYMLKTKIVPPVCPACPACKGGSACTNCGGNGGSGTMSSGGGSMVADTNAGGAITNVSTNAADAVSNISGDVASTAKTGIVTTGLLAGGVALEAGALASDAGSGAVNLAKSAGSGASNLATKAASGSAEFVKDAASGTAGFVKDAASGAVGLGKEIVGGTVDLAKETVKGAIDLTGINDDDASTSEDTSSDGTTINKAGNQINAPMVLGTQNQYSDQYSYYGTLPAKKPSNFIPVTADFSKFGK
jgi:hypothetical protein